MKHNDNKANIVEYYAADKRTRNSESERDMRATRSGKKLKVHDTVPVEHLEKRKASKQNGSSSDKILRTSPKTAKTLKKRTSVTAVNPSSRIQADDILKAKVFNVSLEQLLPLKGLRSEIFQKTKRTRKSMMPKRDRMETDKINEQFFADKGKKIRQAKVDSDSLGAPRVTAIVEGCMKGDCLLDAGAQGSIISARLVKELDLKIVNHKNQATNKMADGSVVKSLGDVEDLLVSVQGVLFKVNPVVFENPPYDLLLGGDSIQVLELAVDYANGHFSINTDNGVEPLKVCFNTPIKRMEHIQPASFISDSEVYSGDDETSENEEYDGDSPTDDSYDNEESYLILPAFEEDSQVKEFYLNEIETQASQIPRNPTSKEEKCQILEEQVDGLELEEKEKLVLKSLLLKYVDVFGLDYQDLKQTNLVKFAVDTGDHPPIMKRPNKHMSHSELEVFKKELAKMLANGQLVPTMHNPKKDGTSSLGWAFPAMYVGKRDTKEGRLVVQFQDLNAVTKKDPWPLPSLQHLMEDYLGSEIFTALDLLKGFNQILVEDDSIPKLTMATPWGCFSYRVLPFGVVNGPACFSRAIYLAMQNYISSFVSTYIDDITIYSKSFDEHMMHVEKVLQRLKEVNMVLKPAKAAWCKKEVSVLGFVVNKQGIKTHPNLVNKILDFPRPKNKTDIRAFSSLAGFYRRHVNRFSDIIAPLNELLKKTAKMDWTDIQEKAFMNIKEAISKAVQLKYPDPNKPYKLFTDASDVGIGAVLVQHDDELGEDRPVCFLSRKLLAAEMKYPTVEKELLGVVYAFSRLRRYLLDKEFTLYTDNSAVRYLFTKSDPGSRLQRWIIAVQEFKFKVFHLPGKMNVVADVMSRYPPANIEEWDMVSPDQYLFESWLVENEVTEAACEDYLVKIYGVLKCVVSSGEHDGSELKSIGLRFRLSKDGHLLRKVGDRYVKVPRIDERVTVLKEVHDGHGHFGQEATWKRLYMNYWWPNAYNEVRDYVKSCESCQLFSYLPAKEPLIGKIPVRSLFERFGVDYIGPFPTSRSGKEYIIMAVEYYTGWPIARAVEKADSDTTIKFLYEDLFCVFGPITKILSDNGRHFFCKEVEAFAKFVNFKHQFAAPYKPSTNGKVEQINGTIVRGIRKMIYNNKKDWDTLLPSMPYAYRTKVHKAIGISPYEALFGSVPNNVNEDPLYKLGMKLGLERLYYLMDKRLNYEEMVMKEDEKRPEKSERISVGDEVMMKKHLKKDKLDSSFKNSLFTVVNQYHRNTYVLVNNQGVKLKRAVNGVHLKKFVRREGTTPKLFNA
ncbi:hypothetical protein G6F46_007107 [Rhizopus delemar]|nr:hypothetical protein G6F46_007107 [Rhizopus delemar]KAG1631041.1 hypothetical protein G6F44_011157 [Rhizopus delemar]